MLLLLCLGGVLRCKKEVEGRVTHALIRALWEKFFSEVDLSWRSLTACVLRALMPYGKTYDVKN